jgi:quercetin dioxygenase-like cupin family protein
MSEPQQILIDCEEGRVRIMTLQGREEVPWHTHSVVTDNIFCLEGRVAVDLLEPQQTVTLHPGDRCEVASRRPHRVMNLGSERARYLLVQGGGRYDFNAVAS